MDTNNKIREHISALCDGELADDDVELGLAALRSDIGAEAWATYHLIGDVLRNTAAPDLSAEFHARLAWRLQKEAPVRPVVGAASGVADALQPIAAAPHDSL